MTFRAGKSDVSVVRMEKTKQAQASPTKAKGAEGAQNGEPSGRGQGRAHPSGNGRNRPADDSAKDALQGDVAIGLQGAYVWKPQRADPEAREAESRFAEVVRLRGGGSASPTRVVLLI